jgi:hypothetical protein
MPVKPVGIFGAASVVGGVGFELGRVFGVLLGKGVVGG